MQPRISQVHLPGSGATFSTLRAFPWHGKSRRLTPCKQARDLPAAADQGKRAGGDVPAIVFFGNNPAAGRLSASTSLPR
jgi:hypothetical protein